MISRAVVILVVAMATPAAAADPQHHWSSAFPSSRIRVDAIATDLQNNVIVVGFADPNTDVGGGRLNGWGPDVFAAKFDPFGNHIWSKAFRGSLMYQEAHAVATDEQGNIVIVGAFSGTIDFGAGPLTSKGLDVFVAKLGPNGNPIWSKGFGSVGSSANFGEDVAIDASGNIIVGGRFTVRINFGGGLLTCMGAENAFVVKFDPAGNHLWSHRFGSVWWDQGWEVGVDANGDAVVAGSFYQSILVGQRWLYTTGENIFVARVRSDGIIAWSRKYGDSTTKPFTSMAVDHAGSLIAAGEFSGSIDFIGGVLTSPPDDTDGYIVSIDAAGQYRWHVQFGGVQMQSVRGLALDPSGNVGIVGVFEGLTDLNGYPRESAGATDVFAARINSNGQCLWAESFPGPEADAAVGIAADAEGNLVLTGTFGKTIDFGGGPLHGGGASNVYLARLGEGSIEPSLNVSLVHRGRAIEARWDIVSRRPLERFVVLRDNESRTEPKIVAAGPIGSGEGAYLDQDVAAGKTYQYELVVFTPTGVEYRAPIATTTVPSFVNHLAQNAPNPFASTTSIGYELGARAEVSLAIYDVAGALVRRLREGARDPGDFAVEWDGRDDAGRPVGSGVYFYRIEGVSGVAPRKMVLLK